MADEEPTSHQVRAHGSRGEAVEPDRSESAVGDGRGYRAHDPSEPRPASQVRVPISPPPGEIEAPLPGVPEATRGSSSELARQSQKARRRARDARAERAALWAVLGGFVTLGVAALVILNSGVLDDPPRDKPAPTPMAEPSADPTPEPARTTTIDETPDIPALGQLRGVGLTIVAEGLPEVVAVDPAQPPPMLAGLETCRFAYGIWELSPNRAFRFFTTCGALAGQVLVGAYEIDGSRVRMSPLSADGITLTSVFQVEKPSTMTTQVVAAARGLRFELEVRQRITGMRPGMDAASFVKAYMPRNTVVVAGLQEGGVPAPRGRAARPEAPPANPAKDPVQELLDP